MNTGPEVNFKERYLSASDGLSLYVRDYDMSSRECSVLCLGGLTRNSKDFHRVACRLSSSFRVIAPDYRGRGRSAYDPNWRHYQPQVYLDDIRHLTVALGVHEFAVIGTSLGGALAMALGTAMPGSVRGALLNDIGPVVPVDGLAPIFAYMRDTKPRSCLDDAVAHLQATFPYLPAKNPEEWRRIAEATYRENDKGQLVFDWDPAIVKPFESEKSSPVDLWPYFRSLLHVPVLAIRGALSKFVTDDLWQEMRNGHADLDQVTVSNVGHAPSLDEPEVVSAMERWLGRVFYSKP